MNEYMEVREQSKLTTLIANGMKKLLRPLRSAITPFISRRIQSEDYSKCFQHARVVIMGPNCLLTERDIEQLSLADICVVMNKGRRMAIYPEILRLSKRIAYFHCLDESPLWGGGPLNTIELRRAGFRELFYPLADDRLKGNVEQFHAKNLGLLPLKRVARSIYGDVELRLGGFRPTSGSAIIASLARVVGCELYVTGITFYRKAYMPEYSSHLLDLASIKLQMEGHGIHHPDREFIEFMRLRKVHGIATDEQLEAIMDAPYVPLFYTDDDDPRRVPHVPAEVVI